MRIRTRPLRRPLPRRVALVGTALLTAAAALPQASADAERVPSGGGLSAVIRYTENGIPHFLARDDARLGFGTGWAQAADQVCVLAGGFLMLSAGPVIAPRSRTAPGTPQGPATTTSGRRVLTRTTSPPAPLRPSASVRSA
ncbi:penicillin acylase family protein [Streptomyces sp. NPDC002602]|uniref:penicillin acylase family protein n=1 Tax=Streptomyces sp. NPDC002602 TaxID=3364654 RepID=UPI0036CD4EE1